jgi:hypothetical protein
MKETGNLQMITPDFYRKIWKWFSDRDSYVVDGIPFGVDTGEDIDLSCDTLVQKTDILEVIEVEADSNPNSPSGSIESNISPDKTNEVDKLLSSVGGTRKDIVRSTPSSSTLFVPPKSVLPVVTDSAEKSPGMTFTANMSRKRTGNAPVFIKTEDKRRKLNILKSLTNIIIYLPRELYNNLLLYIYFKVT